MKLTRQHFEFIAKEIMPYVYMTDIEPIADKLAETNELFNKDKFMQVSTNYSEARHHNLGMIEQWVT